MEAEEVLFPFHQQCFTQKNIYLRKGKHQIPARSPSMSQQEIEIQGLEKQCSLLQRKVNTLNEGLIKAYDEAAKFKLKEDLKEATQQLEKAKERLDEAKGKRVKSSDATQEKTSLLHDYHRLTCDRKKQDDEFKGISTQPPSHVNFLYIYGLDRHAHEALVERFAYELKGLLLDYLNTDMQARCEVEQAETIYLELNDNLEAYKVDILTQLFAVFGVDANNCGPILERDLNYLWTKSSRLQRLQAQDWVCCYLMIPELDWDIDITPKLVTWLIDEFCGDTLPPEAPRFCFFLGIEFEEEDSEVKEEVETAIRAGGRRVKILPELNTLSGNDLKRWFYRYRDYLPRRAKYTDHFKAQNTYYMDDVVVELQRLIDTINKPAS